MTDTAKAASPSTWSDMELAWLAYALLTRQSTSIDSLLSALRMRARETDSRASARLVPAASMRH